MSKCYFLCRVLSVQKRKCSIFLYVSGFDKAKQLLIKRELYEKHNIRVMSVIKGICSEGVNNKGKSIYIIDEVESCVAAVECDAYHECFTNKAHSYRLCRNDIINKVHDFLRSESFQMINSPFTLPYRGTSIASPLKIEGKFVNRYCKITHEFALKKAMAENLQPVYEIGYVARDMYTTVSNWFEYSVLEFVSPTHNISFISTFIEEFIKIAVESAELFALPHYDFSCLKIIELDEEFKYEGVDFEKLRQIEKNAIFINAPVNSPLVKKIDGKRRETIWVFNGESMAHGYKDENNWEAIYDLSCKQMEELEKKGVEGEFSRDFLSLMKIGVPESISIGFGIDRFFQFFFGFETMKAYRQFISYNGAD